MEVFGSKRGGGGVAATVKMQVRGVSWVYPNNLRGLKERFCGLCTRCLWCAHLQTFWMHGCNGISTSARPYGLVSLYLSPPPPPNHTLLLQPHILRRT